ncbi:hypothetical protein J2W79_003301 [Methylorubrum extorquens]|nr:hypothetical protein [Methylorubrum extorquens]
MSIADAGRAVLASLRGAPSGVPACGLAEAERP